jgi:hypothetical protein
MEITEPSLWMVCRLRSPVPTNNVFGEIGWNAAAATRKELNLGVERTSSSLALTRRVFFL